MQYCTVGFLTDLFHLQAFKEGELEISTWKRLIILHVERIFLK